MVVLTTINNNLRGTLYYIVNFFNLSKIVLLILILKKTNNNRKLYKSINSKIVKIF